MKAISSLYVLHTVIKKRIFGVQKSKKKEKLINALRKKASEEEVNAQI